MWLRKEAVVSNYSNLCASLACGECLCLIFCKRDFYVFRDFIFTDGKATDKIFTDKRMKESFFLPCYVDLLSLIGVSEVF